jgi:hypothetical protein
MLIKYVSFFAFIYLYIDVWEYNIVDTFLSCLIVSGGSYKFVVGCGPFQHA